MISMLGNQGKVISLIGLTAILLTAHFFSQKSINILHSKGSIVTANDYGGGDSVAVSIPSDTERTRFLCQIPDSGTHAFCEYAFLLGNDRAHGIDLSDYDELHIDIEMTRNGLPVRNFPLRLYLQNYDERLPAHWRNKTHQIDVDTYHFRHALTFPLNYIQVADWWRTKSQTDAQNGVVDLTNVVKLSVLTPENAPQGIYQITIKNIIFDGKLVSNTFMYGGLTLMWILFFLHHTLKIVSRSAEQQKQLRQKLIHLAERSQQLRKQALSDPLTQVLNRTGGLEQARRLKLLHGKFCLLYMDLDHFKQLNDQFGHHTGDLVLQDFVLIVQRRLHTQGTLIRWGGEEFLALVKCNDIESAYFLARNIRRDLAAHHWPHHQAVTCSIGIACCDVNTPFQRAAENADSALYQAKHRGRDRIEIYDVDKTKCTLQRMKPEAT